MPNKVTDMEVDEVSLVDRGANQRSDVLLYKRDEADVDLVDEHDDDGQDVDQDVAKRSCSHCGGRMAKGRCKDCGYKVDGSDDGSYDMGKGESEGSDEDEPVDHAVFIDVIASDPDLDLEKLKTDLVEKIGRKMARSRLDQIRGVHDTLSQVLSEVDPPPADPEEEDEEGSMAEDMTKGAPDRPSNLDLSVLDEDVRAYVEQLEKRSTPPTDLEEIYKGLQEAKDMVAKAQAAERDAKELAKRHEAEVAKAKEEVAKARSAENLRECVAKAAAWGNLPIAASDLGNMLHEFRQKASEQHVRKLEDLLSRANGILKVEHAFEELGKTGTFDGGRSGHTNSQVDVLAREFQMSNPDMSHAEAVSKALEQRPDLYEQYLSDSRGR